MLLPQIKTGRDLSNISDKMNNNFLRLRSQKLLNICLAAKLKERGKNMILNKKKYWCPYCGGRLFDYICIYREPLSDIEPIGCYPAIRIKATPHKACAEDAPTDFFVRLYRNFAGILTYVKGFLCKMTENMSADSVQSRQASFVQCCLKCWKCRMKVKITYEDLVWTPPIK